MLLLRGITGVKEKRKKEEMKNERGENENEKKKEERTNCLNRMVQRARVLCSDSRNLQ